MKRQQKEERIENICTVPSLVHNNDKKEENNDNKAKL